MTQPSRRPASVASAYPTPHRARIAADEPESKPWGKLIVGVIALIIACVVGGYILFQMRPTHPTGPQPGEDERIYSMMDDYGVEDLQQWLDRGSRMVMGMEAQQAISFRKEALNRGAKQVLAFKGGMMTVSLVIELPDDPAKRKDLFEWWNDRWYSKDNAVHSDVGQKFILVIMRP